MYKIVYCIIINHQNNHPLMTFFIPSCCVAETNPLAKKAYLDWEQKENRAATQETAYARQDALQQAQELGPRFVLHRLPQNFWVAQLLPQWGGWGWGSEITGCTDLFPIGDHIIFFRSHLPEQEIRENLDLSFLPF